MAANGGKCFTHGHECFRNNVGPIDNASFGTPCTPFTSFRKNKRSVPTKQHNDYDCTFKHALDYLRNYTPASGFAEQVAGFFKTFKEVDATTGIEQMTSYGAKFMAAISQMGYYCCHIHVHQTAWLDVPRERYLNTVFC